MVNPTYTPWIGPTATTQGGSSSSNGSSSEEDKGDNDVNDDNDEADDDKGSTLVCTCESDTLNCPPSGQDKTAIRNCFNLCRSQGKGDVHNLDGDDDGEACE